MNNTQDGDELETVIDFPHDERHDQLFHDPHSALCSEDVDWGAGSAWPADAVTCLVSNRRRGDQPCHTVDLVLLDRTGQRIHWVASWPEIGSEECVVVSEYGNTSLIGDPNPSGDGQTRLVLYSPQTAQIDVLQLHVDPDGTAVFSSEYRLREAPKDSNIHLEGYFITAMPGFGAPHHVERLTPTGR